MNITFDELVKLKEFATRSHFRCDDDNWYSCPKAPDGCANDSVGTGCNCGADEHNKEVNDLIMEIILKNPASV